MPTLEEDFIAQRSVEETEKKATIMAEFENLLSEFIASKRQDPYKNGMLHTVLRSREVEFTVIPARRMIFGTHIPAQVVREVQKYTEILVLFEIEYVSYHEETRLFTSPQGELFTTDNYPYHPGSHVLVPTDRDSLYNWRFIEAAIVSFTDHDLAFARSYH